MEIGDARAIDDQGDGGGESARCSASFFKLMGLRAARAVPSALGLGGLVATERSLAH